MLHKHSHFYWIVFGLVACGVSLLITNEWAAAISEMDLLSSHTLFTNELIHLRQREKPPKQTVKGIFLTAVSANSPTKLDAIIKLIDETELNAVVIDIKDFSGYILYNSKVPLVNELKTERVSMKEVSSIIRKLHEHQIYTIARQTVFQDPILAAKKPEWAIKNKGGGVWRDHNGLSWVDPTKQEVWEYNVAIAKEAIQLGFDEINFDYVRFPSDGNLKAVAYSNGTKPRYEVMGDFYQYLGEALSEEPAWISLDFFGLVMDAKGTNDLGIGQRLVDAVDSVDYISPMMYPSHYGAGYAGQKNPAAAPGIVIETGMKKGASVFKDKRAELRPWLQAFNIGAVYNADRIRAQIDATEKYRSEERRV